MMRRLLPHRQEDALETARAPALAPSPEDRPVIEFRDVSIFFDDPAHPVLDRISFTVYRGEMRILLGPTAPGNPRSFD